MLDCLPCLRGGVLAKVGDRDVAAMGTIVTHHGDRIIDLTYENLTYRLIFADTGDHTPRVSAEIFGDRLEITLTNFDNSLGTSWFGEVGKINGRTLYLSFA